MSDDEDEGPTMAKKRMLEENLCSLSQEQVSAKKSVTGLIRVRREERDNYSDPPVKPFTAVIETVSLVVSNSSSQRSQTQRMSQSSDGSDGSNRPNFKAFVRKGLKTTCNGQQSVSLVESKLKRFNRIEYQVITAFPLCPSQCPPTSFSLSSIFGLLFRPKMRILIEIWHSSKLLSKIPYANVIRTFHLSDIRIRDDEFTPSFEKTGRKTRR